MKKLMMTLMAVTFAIAANAQSYNDYDHPLRCLWEYFRIVKKLYG